MEPPKLQVGSVLGRTLDQFLAHPLEFASLAIPFGLLSLVSVLIDTTKVGASGSLAISIISGIIGVVFGLATIVASDQVRSGLPIDLGRAIATALGRTVTGLLSDIAVVLIFSGLFIVLGIAIAIPLLAGSGLVAAILGVIVGALMAYVAIRWGLSQAAIVLDRAGPVGALGSSWRVTRGNALRLVGLYLVIALITLPISIGVGFGSLVAPDARLAALVGAALTLVTIPIGAIASTTAYGDLTGRPFDAAANPSRPTLRWALIAILVVLGIGGVAIAIPNLGTAYQRIVTAASVNEPGVVHFGTAANPINPCAPSDTKTDFASSESIYIGGYFNAVVPSGGTATESVYANGALVGSGELPPSGQPTACFAEAQPLTGAPPGSYRIDVTYQGQTIATGSFTVH